METSATCQKKRDRIAEAVKTIIECLGEDVQREGLLRTPVRYAEAMLFLTQGYEQSVEGKRAARDNSPI